MAMMVSRSIHMKDAMRPTTPNRAGQSQHGVGMNGSSNGLLTTHGGNLYQQIPTSEPSEPSMSRRQDTDWVGVSSGSPSKPSEGAPAKSESAKPEPGEVDYENMDIDDAPFRLASLKTTVFDTYAVCAALLSSFSCATTFISDEEIQSYPGWRKYPTIAQQVIVRVCILGGIHAMLVFMFCALYAKTALARQNFGLKVYETFSGSTGGVRQTAFWSMYYTSIMYMFQIVLTNFYSLDLITACIASAILLMCIARVVSDAQTIIKAAGCIFMPDDAVRQMIKDEKEQKRKEKEEKEAAAAAAALAPPSPDQAGDESEEETTRS